MTMPALRTPKMIATGLLTLAAMLCAALPALAGSEPRILGKDKGLFSQPLFSNIAPDGAGNDPLAGITDQAERKLLQRAFPKMSALWANGVVYVCWENPMESDPAKRELVKMSIDETWGAISQLQFRGWGDCVPESAGLRIKVEDINPMFGPHVKALGNEVDGIKDGMVLNFTFNTWSQSCKTRVDECIRIIAVHEFGHAIGYAHEQNRTDTPSDCFELPQGDDGSTIALTAWDKNSVMNYCADGYLNDGKLSELDIEATKLIYGAIQ